MSGSDPAVGDPQGPDPTGAGLLIGDAGDAGLVQKFKLGVETLTAEEQGFMEQAPWGLGGAIRTLARQEPGMAIAFAERAAPIIAVELVQLLVRDMLSSVRWRVAPCSTPMRRR